MDRQMTCPYCKKEIGKLPLKDCLAIKLHGSCGLGVGKDIRCPKCHEFFDVIVSGVIYTYKKGELNA